MSDTPIGRQINGIAPEDGWKRTFLVNIRTVLIVGLTWIVTLAVQWGLFSARMDENTRRIRDLEAQHFVPGDQTVTKDQFNQFREDILQRLIRMEGKLDQIR